MPFGYMGKILRADLTSKKTSTIDTMKYADFMGGVGMGAAIYWDLVAPNWTMSAYDPRSPVLVMTGPLTGTLTPTSGRTEIVGKQLQSYPLNMFTYSGMGGRWGPMLKFAGWDGVIIEGKADKPVWIWISDDDVEIRDASDLWGLNSFDAQEEIHNEFAGKQGYGSWLSLEKNGQRGRMTTQHPAVAVIGPAGENLSRIGSICNDSQSTCGQGGFGGIWGSKNLKAIGVIGSGSVDIADPKSLLEMREWSTGWQYDINHPLPAGSGSNVGSHPRVPAPAGTWGPWGNAHFVRPLGCFGCQYCDRGNYAYAGLGGGESQCNESMAYSGPDRTAHGAQTIATAQGALLLDAYGLNGYEFNKGLPWLYALYKEGFFDPKTGKVPSNLPWDKYGETLFADALYSAVAYRKDIGADLAEGLMRACVKWGRTADLNTGLYNSPHWGYNFHYDPRIQSDWGFGTIMDSRDINDHDFNFTLWWPTSNNLTYDSTKGAAVAKTGTIGAFYPLDVLMNRLNAVIGDSRGADNSDDNFYTEHTAREVAWHRHYAKGWKRSTIICDFVFFNFMNRQRPDLIGLSPKMEEWAFQAVTGKKTTYADGLEIGRRIWNLQRAINILEGKTRDIEIFSNYIYDTGVAKGTVIPGYKDGQWQYVDISGRKLTRDGVEKWKNIYYGLEGWDPATGWPKRSTLEGLNLKYVADELQSKGKLGTG